MSDEIPREITLPAATVAALMDDPALMEEMEQAEAQGGTAGLIEWLDAHGLRWREGGSSAAAAFADAAAFGGLEFEPLWPTPVSGGPDRRKAARKASRKARRATRRR